MQRFKVHSHSQAVSPTHRSLQPVASSSVQTLHITSEEYQPITSGELYLSLVENQPFIGGESVLIGSIFDVFSCRLLRKIGKI